MASQEYVSLDRAASELDIDKSTLHYYLKKLQIKSRKFELDRKSYLTVEDYQRIKTLKEAANNRNGNAA